MSQSARVFNCERCHQQVIICSHCDRGNIYCAGQCATQARKEKTAKAQKTYQQSPKGRETHAQNQMDYRQRQREKVTHQSSQKLVDYDVLLKVKSMATSGEHPVLNEKTMSVRRQLTVKQEVAVTQQVSLTKKTVYRCHFCGCRCSEKLRWAKFYRQNRHYVDMAQLVMDSFPKPTG
jgi:hypothetical protein